MREIKFRGKRKDNGQWIYGGIHRHFTSVDGTEVVFVIGGSEYRKDTGWVNICNMHEVDIDTVGQYTGLKDKNDKEIYEGDLIENDYRILQVVWSDDCAGFRLRVIKTPYTLSRGCQFPVAQWVTPDTTILHGKIIGNIYENTELLGGSKHE